VRCTHCEEDNFAAHCGWRCLAQYVDVGDRSMIVFADGRIIDVIEHANEGEAVGEGISWREALLPPAKE